MRPLVVPAVRTQVVSSEGDPFISGAPWTCPGPHPAGAFSLKPAAARHLRGAGTCRPRFPRPCQPSGSSER